MTTATWAVPARATREAAAQGTPLGGRGWRAYLVLATLLTPFVLPPGPAQLAVLDVLNLAALAVFFAVAAARRPPVVLPFVVPVIVIGVGSLLAVTNAVSVGASVLALAQDAYLYLWFTALVALMSRQGELFAVRAAWTAVAVVVALVVIGQAAAAGAFPGRLLAAEGFRPAGTFYGANMAADYLVLSMFVAASLWKRVHGLVLAASLLVLFLGLVVTKSNGSLLAFLAGAGVTVVLWALRAEGSRARRAGVLALCAALGVLAFGALTEWGVGAKLASGVGRESLLGRMEKSSGSRKVIWGQLGGQLARHPLGIGPGNSVLQDVAIGHRVRPGSSFQSKEAHSDYVAYATERGPIGLVGQLLWVFAGIGLVLGLGAPARAAGTAVAAPAAGRLAFLRAVFVGGLVASAIHSLVIEKLHFRHYWMFLALACAATAGERFRPAGRPGDAAPAPGPALAPAPAPAPAGGAR